MTPTQILVVIVNYRTPDLTSAAVAAIRPEIMERGDVHIVIADNASGDGSPAMLEAAVRELGLSERCSVLSLDDNLGFAAGNNAAIAFHRNMVRSDASPSLIWLLNPDTVAQPGALAALVDFMVANPRAGIIGGRCLWPDGQIRRSAFRFPSPFSELLASLDLGLLNRLFSGCRVPMPIIDTPYQTDWVGGSHLMLRGEVYDRLGSIDEGYFLYFEETDYCARAAAAEIERWHVPASTIVHIGGQATGVTGDIRPTERRPRYWFASRARFFLKRYGAVRTHLANLLWLLFYPPGFALALLRGRPRQDPPKLWRDFLGHYYGRGGLMYRPGELIR